MFRPISKSQVQSALPLAESTLGFLDARVEVPMYRRESLRPDIVHLGLGGFHRAHQAVYFDDLASRDVSRDWGIVGVSLRSDRMRRALEPQDSLFTVLERSPSGDRARVVGSVARCLYGPDNPQEVLRALAAPTTRIVTLTVTGDGYGVDREDLSNPARPSSVAGFLTEALRMRRDAGLAPFSIMSCDNVPSNGDVARAAVTAFASLRDDALAAWISAEVAFPSTVVDRITPETTPGHRQLLADEFGVKDRWPVVAEGFRQWIVEDTFSNGRPPLEEVGVDVVADVEPYELVKKRMLNGGHSALGYLGALSGYAKTSSAMFDPQLHGFIDALLSEEVQPLLPEPPGIDLDCYRQELLERFGSEPTGDQLSRLCRRGSTKMASYLVPSLVEAIDQNRTHERLTIAVAAWFQYLSGVDCDGRPIDVIDPIKDQLQPLARRAQSDPRPLLRECEMFGDLAENDTFVASLTTALEALKGGGPAAAMVLAQEGELALAA